MTAEYYRLGDKAVLFVSAEHKINVGELEEAIVAALPGGEAVRDDRTPLRIAIVGRTNVGKSSLVNRLAGEERLIVSEMPGTTRDSTDTLLVRDGKLFSLVDTAGIRKIAAAEDGREKAGIIRPKENIRRADVVCLVLDAARVPHPAGRPDRPAGPRIGPAPHHRPQQVGPGRQGRRPARGRARPRLPEARLRQLRAAPLRLGPDRPAGRQDPGHGRAGLQSASTRIGTSKLNDFLARTAEDHPPRLKSGARAKLRYMTQKGVCPPTFILFLGARGPISPTYEKYFVDSLREEFGSSVPRSASSSGRAHPGTPGGPFFLDFRGVFVYK